MHLNDEMGEPVGHYRIAMVKGILALDSRGNPTVKAIVKTRGGGAGVDHSGADGFGAFYRLVCL